MSFPVRIVILGGYGTTGRYLTDLLLHESGVELVLAGRNLSRAEACAAEFNAHYGGNPVSAMRADAADADSLAKSLAGADLVLVASSTSDHASTVARVALASGCDYFDVQYSADKLTALEDLRDSIRSAGRCFITDGGFHPGIPAALVRVAAAAFDELTSARVASVVQIDWSALELGPETMSEFVHEFLGFQALEFRDGEWRVVPMTGKGAFPIFDFGPPFGQRACFPMPLAEMHLLPERYPTLRKCGFYIAGFNPIVDNILTPAVMLALRVSPRHLTGIAGRLYYWGLRTFSRPPYGTLLRLEAEGLAHGEPARVAITLSHPDGYRFTAAPVVACLRQWLSGDRRPGLWFQAEFVEPRRFLRDLESMGIDIAFEDERRLLGAWATSDIMPG